MLTAADIQGAELSKPLVLFWYHHQEGAGLTTATLSWLSFIPNMLTHLAPLSRSPQLRSLKLCNRCSCSHVCVSNHLPANFTIHYSTLHAAKEQRNVTSDIPCIFSLACNWSTGGVNQAEVCIAAALNSSSRSNSMLHLISFHLYLQLLIHLQ